MAYLPKPRDKKTYKKTDDDAIDVDSRLLIIQGKKQQILDRLESGEGIDLVTQDLTNTILQSLVSLLPSIEEAAHKSSRGVYPLEKVVNAIRELSHDLRSMEDRGAMRQRIVNDILDPNMLELVRKQIVYLNRLHALVKDDAQAIEYVDAMRASLAENVNATRVMISDKLDAYFGGEGGAKGIVRSDHTGREIDEEDFPKKHPKYDDESPRAKRVTHSKRRR